MNKIATYLQGHISGEVLVSENARDYFSTDASILKVKPALIVYPRTANDIRKVARFTWQLAEKGHALPITARGGGTDLSGAAIGKGIIMSFPAHLNKILELDTKQKLVRVQPGVNFKSLEETLHTHGLFLPPYPASFQYSTIGGAIANNSGGEKSFRHGTMREWVEKLEVVLANGEVIQTGRVSKKELNKKKGLPTLEGEIYRAVDGIVTENEELLDKVGLGPDVTKNSVGYDLLGVKRRDGSLDLTPLFVGSQGTLGIITEAILKVAPYSPHSDLIVAGFADVDTALQAIDIVHPLKVDAIEMVDHNLLDFAAKHQGTALPAELLLQGGATPAIVLFISCDDPSDRNRSKLAKKIIKTLRPLTENVVSTADPDEQEKLWALRHSAASVTNFDHDGKAALPVVEDGIVPAVAFNQFITEAYKLFEKHHLEVALWGHAGDSNLHMQPLLDLKKLGDRQKAFKLMDEYYKLVIKLGGSIAAEHNDGRLRAPYVAAQVGADIHELYVQLKAAFDPHGTLNPGVKTGTTLKELVDMLRDSYSLAHLAEHLPRT